jgi:hypothetical protein
MKILTINVNYGKIKVRPYKYIKILTNSPSTEFGFLLGALFLKLNEELSQTRRELDSWEALIEWKEFFPS